MKLPTENRVCFFCKHGECHHHSLVWCSNTQAVHARRVEKYGTIRLSRVSGETRYSYQYCGSFQERGGAATEFVTMKLTGKYRKQDHEKKSGGSLTSG